MLSMAMAIYALMQIPAFIEMRKTVCLKTVTTYLLQLLKPFLKILRLLLLFVTLSMPFY